MLGKILFLLSLAAVGLAGCSAHTASPHPLKETAPAAGEVGSRLPDFVVKDLQGREISSADLRGKVCSWTLGYLVPAVQERDAWLPKTPRPVCTTGICRNRI